MAEPDIKAREVFARFEYARMRGHADYQRAAKRNEEMYLGGGLQWSEEDRAVLEEENRPAYEVNSIKVAVDAAVGYQINNRVDISFTPRGGLADDKTAEILNRVVMQIADGADLNWSETQAFTDGMIQQRGYFDVRVDFDDNMRGSAEITTLDPMDVVPDPDAKGYDPKTWGGVRVTRWLTYDEIEQVYGQAARGVVERTKEDDPDWGENDAEGVERAKFGMDTFSSYSDHILERPGESIPRVRVIDEQRWVYSMVRVAVTDTGDVREIPDASPAQIAQLEAAGAIITRRMQRRVRWTVATLTAVLHDDWSPYPFFTVVPYFPYFRRGQTRGMVDNAIGPQEIVNKAISQYIHVVNTTANSGWTVEENSLKNMRVEDLEVHGSSTGLVIEYKQGAQPPEKIQPNQVPSGVDRIIDRAFIALKETTVPDAMRGLDGNQQDSGIAIQSRQFAAQQQLAVALDNLSRTRHMIARRLLWIVQHFYDEERTFRIAETHPVTGKEVSYSLPVNVFNPLTGNVVNDLTVGEYDVVIGEQPAQVTYSNTQFDQALEMRREGIAIPDTVLVRTSMLTNKAEVLDQMQQRTDESDPVTEAETKLKMAQAAKYEAEAVQKQAATLKTQAETKKVESESVGEAVEAQYSAIQTAQAIAQLPETASIADSLLKSAGYEDRDEGPIMPQYGIPQQPTVPAGEQADAGSDVVPENTNPLTPSNPDRGMLTGFEGGES